VAADKSYKTSDIHIKAWSLSKGLELQGIDRHNIRRCEFILIDRPDRPQLLINFCVGQRQGTSLTSFLYEEG